MRTNSTKRRTFIPRVIREPVRELRSFPPDALKFTANWPIHRRGRSLIAIDLHCFPELPQEKRKELIRAGREAAQLYDNLNEIVGLRDDCIIMPEAFLVAAPQEFWPVITPRILAALKESYGFSRRVRMIDAA